MKNNPSGTPLSIPDAQKSLFFISILPGFSGA
jgi:hypothetical protein